MFLYRYWRLFSSLWLVSMVTKNFADEIEINNNSPLILIPHENTYLHPNKVQIYADQTRQYYHSLSTQVEFFCPDENQNPECEYCVFKKTFNIDEDKICKKEVKPLIINTVDDSGNPKKCGSSSTVHSYEFVYKVCAKRPGAKKSWTPWQSKKENGVQEILYPQIYEICYDARFPSVKYTKHRIMFPDIVRRFRSGEEQTPLINRLGQYSTEGYLHDAIQNYSNKLLNAYNRQRAEPEDREYQLQMLVPIEDFALGHWKKTTLNIVNHKPQHKSKVPLWNAVNSHIRSRLTDLYNEIGDVMIYTGVWGWQSDHHQDPIYLGNNPQFGILIPRLWWKMLYATEHDKAIVIIMHNVDNVNKICNPEEAACNVTKWQTTEDEEYLKNNLYCCSFISVQDYVAASAEFDLINMSSKINILQLD